jgi:hypothetical protein
MTYSLSKANSGTLQNLEGDTTLLLVPDSEVRFDVFLVCGDIPLLVSNAKVGLDILLISRNITLLTLFLSAISHRIEMPLLDFLL